MPEPLSVGAEEYLSWLAVEKGRSRNTLLAYRRDIATFEQWAEAESVDTAAVGPDDLERYLGAIQPRWHGPQLRSVGCTGSG